MKANALQSEHEVCLQAISQDGIAWRDERIKKLTSVIEFLFAYLGADEKGRKKIMAKLEEMQ